MERLFCLVLFCCLSLRASSYDGLAKITNSQNDEFKIRESIFDEHYKNYQIQTEVLKMNAVLIFNFSKTSFLLYYKEDLTSKNLIGDSK